VKTNLAALFLLSLLCSAAIAAPHPATTSSVLTDPDKGLSFRGFGFKLSTVSSSWRPVQKDSEGLFAEIHFENKDAKTKNPKAQISLRMDDLAKGQNIENYAKKWMRDYPHYGLEVLGTKTFTHSDGQGLVVDLYHRQNNKQLRQVILLKNKKVAIFTCSNDKAKFNEILADCNQLVKNFSWLDSDKRHL
jgi:hypothetical protein